MPDRGAMEPTVVEDIAFTQNGSLVVENASWLQVTFEVDRQAALANMPCEVGRPIPPYGRIFIASAPSLGLALLSVGGRYRLMPRNVVVQAITSDYSRSSGIFGNGSTRGAVQLERSVQDVSATIQVNGHTLFSVSLANLYAIDPTMLRWDGFVAMARMGGAIDIAEVTPAHEPTTAFLSKQPTIVLNPAVERESPWRKLRSLSVISACYAEGTLNFGEAAVQQRWA